MLRIVDLKRSIWNSLLDIEMKEDLSSRRQELSTETKGTVALVDDHQPIAGDIGNCA